MGEVWRSDTKVKAPTKAEPYEKAYQHFRGGLKPLSRILDTEHLQHVGQHDDSEEPPSAEHPTSPLQRFPIAIPPVAFLEGDLRRKSHRRSWIERVTLSLWPSDPKAFQ